MVDWLCVVLFMQVFAFGWPLFMGVCVAEPFPVNLSEVVGGLNGDRKECS